jgi:5-oxoprolinase (ATP-hydrolysing) subunit C
MSKLVAVTAGPVTSVQDAGRFGYQRFGLPPSGVMDLLSLATANCLVENPLFNAAIEIGPFGATFAAQDGAIRVALTGAIRNVDIGGRSVASNCSFVIGENETLRIGPARDGVFSNLAIEGGIRGEPIFGSLAVNVRAGIGSPFPRGLQDDDILDVEAARPRRSECKIEPPIHGDAPIRVVLGPQDDEFSPSAISLFLGSEWRVSSASDRMGYRIDGPSLPHEHGHNIVSDGTVTGSIQVPGSGQPIVLMPDRGTTGGYPKIATVISADLGRFAQLRAGRRFRFEAVSVEEAQLAGRQQAALLRSLPEKISDVPDVAFDLAALHNANVAGVAVNAVDAVAWPSTEDGLPSGPNPPTPSKAHR